MSATILQFLEWLHTVQWATALRESTLMFPLIEGTHLIGLAFILGPVLMLDFRLSGIAWRDQPVSKIATTFVPWSIVGAVLMFVTGILLFCSEPVKCWESGWFRIKIVLMFLAGLNALYFHAKTQSTWSKWDTLATPPLQARMAGILSMILWFGVVFAGRFTAYNL
jgi:hypothetical protein